MSRFNSFSFALAKWYQYFVCNFNIFATVIVVSWTLNENYFKVRLLSVLSTAHIFLLFLRTFRTYIFYFLYIFFYIFYYLCLFNNNIKEGKRKQGEKQFEVCKKKTQKKTKNSPILHTVNNTKSGHSLKKFSNEMLRLWKVGYRKLSFQVLVRNIS